MKQGDQACLSYIIFDISGAMSRISNSHVLLKTVGIKLIKYHILHICIVASYIENIYLQQNNGFCFCLNLAYRHVGYVQDDASWHEYVFKWSCEHVMYKYYNAFRNCSVQNLNCLLV